MDDVDNINDRQKKMIAITDNFFFFREKKNKNKNKNKKKEQEDGIPPKSLSTLVETFCQTNISVFSSSPSGILGNPPLPSPPA